MTFREKLTEQFPLLVEEHGVLMVCPYQFGYEEQPVANADYSCGINMCCRDCWNREIPEDEDDDF